MKLSEKARQAIHDWRWGPYIKDPIEREEAGDIMLGIVFDTFAALETANAELLEALECIAYGCSFPEDAVQRACRDRANKAIRKARGE